MMEQYFKIKEKYKDVLLFYRLGDFYEMFGNDAIVASKELDITLTKRSNGESTMPMCGVPYHSVETYIQKLLSKNFKVALCNQMTQPEKGKLVERSVVRIITRGTVIEDTFLLSDCNNFLLSVFFQNYLFAAAWTDISTGEINFQILDSFVSLNELLSRLSPSEIISNMEMANKSPMISMVKYGECCPFTALDDKFFDYEFAQKNISEQFGSDFFGKLQGNKECICAMGGLLSYIEYTHKKKLKHLSLKGSDKSHFMSIDHNARRTLELFINTVDGKKRNSLLSVLDRTCTGMGSRNIRKWLERPLLSKQKIDERLQGVEEIFLDKEQNADRLNELLCEIKDVERICGRISCELATPADILSLGQTLSIVPKVKNVLNNFNSDIIIKINKSLFDKSKLYSLILSAIKPDHSATIRDGGVIRYGFDKKLDELCSSHDNAEQLIRDLQTNERESTGIKNLKISKNSVFGYFIEVSNSFLNQVPYRYIRKQTVASGERFFTEELKEIEERILSSKEKSIERECEIYKELLSQIYN
jgi:DNA mismatch repair protein MutS